MPIPRHVDQVERVGRDILVLALGAVFLELLYRRGWTEAIRVNRPRLAGLAAHECQVVVRAIGERIYEGGLPDVERPRTHTSGTRVFFLSL